jgi:hypothetical protein
MNKTMKHQNTSNENSRRFLSAAVAASVLAIAASAAAEEQPKDYSGWSLNFTPVLVVEKGYDIGGGLDPELQYTLDRGGARLSAGLRVGGYYAKELVGITAMPTLRLTVPVGPVEPYASFGMGYGWLPEEDHAEVASMSRLGVVFRFTESFGIGLEGTIQKIEDSEFRFPSFGSAVTFDF